MAKSNFFTLKYVFFPDFVVALRFERISSSINRATGQQEGSRLDEGAGGRAETTVYTMFAQDSR